MEKKLLDPRKALALEYYCDPTSETFGVAHSSMIKAGFSHGTAKDPQKLQWFQAHRAQYDVDIIGLSEKKLKTYLEIDVELNSKLNVDIAKLQADLLKFALDRLANKKYGKGTEQEAPAITVNIVAPKAPHATRDAQVVEPEQVDAPSE
jgi:hypothetical protein